MVSASGSVLGPGSSPEDFPQHHQLLSILSIYDPNLLGAGHRWETLQDSMELLEITHKY